MHNFTFIKFSAVLQIIAECIFSDMFSNFITLFYFGLLQYRLVVKTSLKLLLVFVEYSESNATVLYQATCVVDKEQGNLSTQS